MFEGLEIAVHDEVRVGVGDRVGDLEKQLQPGAHQQPMRVGRAVDPEAFDELEDEERLSGRQAGVVEARDAGVGESRQDRTLAEAFGSALLDERRVEGFTASPSKRPSLRRARQTVPMPPAPVRSTGFVGAEGPTLERNRRRPRRRLQETLAQGVIVLRELPFERLGERGVALSQRPYELVARVLLELERLVEKGRQPTPKRLVDEGHGLGIVVEARIPTR